MTFWQFANENTGLTVFMVCAAAFSIFVILDFLFKCWNRLMRSMNIRKNGWPPQHCDADGDFK